MNIYGYFPHRLLYFPCNKDWFPAVFETRAYDLQLLWPLVDGWQGLKAQQEGLVFFSPYTLIVLQTEMTAGSKHWYQTKQFYSMFTMGINCNVLKKIPSWDRPATRPSKNRWSNQRDNGQSRTPRAGMAGGCEPLQVPSLSTGTPRCPKHLKQQHLLIATFGDTLQGLSLILITLLWREREEESGKKGF